MKIISHRLEVPLGYRVSEDGRCRVPVVDAFDFKLRILNRKEFKDWNTECKTSDELEVKILEHCVLEHPKTFRGQPWDWDEVYAGVVASITDKILKVSGFGSEPDPEVIRKVQDYLESEESKYDLLIMMAFNYTLDEVMEMDSETWHIHTGLAQMKLAALGINPDIILEPQAVTKSPVAGPLPAQDPVRGYPTSVKPHKPGVEYSEELEGAFAFYSE
jgi:hypothetical protein